MGDFSSSCGYAQRLGWQHIALTVTLMSLAGIAPAWGQASAPLGLDQATSTSLLLAQASSQQFNRVLFVNPLTGNDQQGEGSLRSPFRSITHAVQLAEPDTVIFLSTGSYTEQSGEQFPIVLPPGVSLMEDPAAERGSIAIAGAVTHGTVAATSRSAAGATQVSPTPARRPATARGVQSQPTRRSSELPSVDVTATIPATPTSRRSAPPAAAVARPDAEQALQGIPIPVPPPDRQARPAVSAEASLGQGRSSQSIPIPVPPPESRRSRARAQTTAVAPSRLPTSSAPIEIPVPPPDNPMPARPSRSAAAPVSSVAYGVRSSEGSAGPYDLLPVPDPNVPMGYTGDMPRVSVASLTGSTRATQAVGGTISRGVGTLQYRVLVPAEDEDVRDWVRSVVPDAFETVADGQTLMQIGAFESRENAEEAADQLSRNGIRAIIEEWR
ncbi:MULTISPECIES: DUF1565 domain-containing protein [unclassified Leptolyngbya]|uniref:DUF1565 domain-containing protein n=1 Tax=unclassified Leptolyngbya TaxID=2650499 RepID=UPI00168399A3|nr:MULTISPECIES: DUF1565 domain-containing protein [unclassified Leptolyngbya]MBD1913313.1 DUF1565 domain-containing protein [Leptolyngbya sp. FACHB-8]MBD2155340.1 DUF1565 domain-containing protein [Leptolyngbya sp. FACHB-16]